MSSMGIFKSSPALCKAHAQRGDLPMGRWGTPRIGRRSAAPGAAPFSSTRLHATTCCHGRAECSVTVPRPPFGSYTRTIQPSPSSAGLIASRMAGPTSSRNEWESGRVGAVGVCLSSVVRRPSSVAQHTTGTLSSQAAAHRLARRQSPACGKQRVGELVLAEVRVGVGRLGAAQQRQPQHVAVHVVAVLAVVQQADAVAAPPRDPPSGGRAPRTSPDPRMCCDAWAARPRRTAPRRWRGSSGRPPGRRP